MFYFLFLCAPLRILGKLLRSKTDEICIYNKKIKATVNPMDEEH